VGVTAERLVRPQTDRAQAVSIIDASLVTARRHAELAERRLEDVVDLVERVVDLVGVLEDHLDVAEELAAVRSPQRAEVDPAVKDVARRGYDQPESRRASVVFPEPDSPTTAVIDGGSFLIASEKSFSACLVLCEQDRRRRAS
jgi:hypothetical protein